MNSKLKSAVSRRDFLRLLKIIGLEAFLLAVGGGIYMRGYEPWQLEIEALDMRLPRLDRSFSGMRVAQISDLHFGGWLTVEYLEQVVQAVLDQSPDLIVITGDFVMGHNYAPQIFEKLGELSLALRPLSEQAPTFGVLGNHDYWLDRSSVIDMLHAAGIEDLNNSVRTLQQGGTSLHIAGVDDALVRQARVDRVLAQLPTDGCAILLAHEPDYADLSARTGRFDLQLSGHSHGGQVVLPFVGPPVLPYLGRKYPSGLYQVGDMLQYTNRGVGMTAPYIRLNCRPEITVFTLQAI